MRRFGFGIISGKKYGKMVRDFTNKNLSFEDIGLTISNEMIYTRSRYISNSCGFGNNLKTTVRV
jgi:hypothetical protein